MWPKVFAQLVELLPHVSRLIPMADVFFATKTANEKATETTLAALAKDVRTDLNGVASAHDGLYRQLQEQSGRLSEVEIDLRRTRIAVDEQLVRTADTNKQVAALGIWVKAAVVLLILVVLLVIALLIVLLRSR